MPCSCIALSLTLPTNCPLPLASLLELFLRSAHEVLKLGPQGFYGTELISHLVTSAKGYRRGQSKEMDRAYCDDTLQIPIQTVDVLEDLFHALS